MAGHGLELIERTVDADEVGGPPDGARCDGMPIAVVRGGLHISFDDPAFQRLEPGDVVVSLSGSARRSSSPGTPVDAPA